MPPIIKISKDDIVNVTYDLVLKEGLEKVNARKIAQVLKCSIQPIFHNFKTMKELKDAVIDKIHNTYQEYSKKTIEISDSYKGMGLAYIKFARDYPNFFRILFMSETKLNINNYIDQDPSFEETIKYGQKLTGFDKATQKQFHFRVWVFTHGLATLIVTKTCTLSDEEIEQLLSDTVIDMLNGYKMRGDVNLEKYN